MIGVRIFGLLLVLLAAGWVLWLGPRVYQAAVRYNDMPERDRRTIPVYDPRSSTGRILQIMMTVGSLFMAVIGIVLVILPL